MRSRKWMMATAVGSGFLAAPVVASAAADLPRDAVTAALQQGCQPWLAGKVQTDVEALLDPAGFASVSLGRVYTRRGPWGEILLQLDTDAPDKKPEEGWQKRMRQRLHGSQPPPPPEKRGCKVTLSANSASAVRGDEAAAALAWVRRAFPKAEMAVSDTIPVKSAMVVRRQFNAAPMVVLVAESQGHVEGVPDAMVIVKTP